MAANLADIQKIALSAVLDPDYSAFMRKVCRWYSARFHTPLHVVEELPQEYILEHYFESIFEDMEVEERNQQIRIVLETPEEREKRLREDEDALAELEKEAAEGLTLDEVMKRGKDLKKKENKESIKKQPLLPPIPKPLDPTQLDDFPDEISLNFKDT